MILRLDMHNSWLQVRRIIDDWVERSMTYTT